MHLGLKQVLQMSSCQGMPRPSIRRRSFEKQGIVKCQMIVDVSCFVIIYQLSYHLCIINLSSSFVAEGLWVFEAWQMVPVKAWAWTLGIQGDRAWSVWRAIGPCSNYRPYRLYAFDAFICFRFSPPDQRDAAKEHCKAGHSTAQFLVRRKSQNWIDWPAFYHGTYCVSNPLL